jgi:hypothetical protein
VERAVAIKKLTKLLGKKLGWRINAKHPTQEEKDAAKTALPAAVAERELLKQRRDERYKTILAADMEYQRLHAEHHAAYERVNRMQSKMHQHKIAVGTIESGFFLVKAEGNSWEEVIDKVAAKEAVS